MPSFPTTSVFSPFLGNASLKLKLQDKIERHSEIVDERALSKKVSVHSVDRSPTGFKFRTDEIDKRTMAGGSMVADRRAVYVSAVITVRRAELSTFPNIEISRISPRRLEVRSANSRIAFTLARSTSYGRLHRESFGECISSFVLRFSSLSLSLSLS